MLIVKIDSIEVLKAFAFVYVFCLENGRIEFEEFAEVVADSYFRKFSRAEILESFRRFDRNHDGFIEAEELKNILAQLGRHFSTEEVRTRKITLIFS